jgi:hypothetical protein
VLLDLRQPLDALKQAQRHPSAFAFRLRWVCRPGSVEMLVLVWDLK